MFEMQEKVDHEQDTEQGSYMSGEWTLVCVAFIRNLDCIRKSA